MWIVVIKKADSPESAIVLRRRTLKSVADYINKKIRTRCLVDWTEPMLETIKTDYRRLSATTIAARLSEDTGQAITKNSVISKANAMGLGKRRALPAIKRSF